MGNFNLPEDWSITTLGKIGYFKNGINKPKEDFGNGYPFVNLLDIFGKNSITHPNLQLVNVSNKELEIYNLKKGDVLFVRSSVKPEGVGLTCVLMNDLLDTVYGGFIIRFRPKYKNFLDKDFCRYCFHSHFFRKSLIRKSSISANTNINQQSLQKLQLFFPPLPEQKAIANILQTWDTAIEKTDALIVAKERRFRWLVHSFIGQQQHKNGWKNVRLHEIGKIITGNTPSKQDAGNYGGDHCWATAEDFKNIDIVDTQIKLSDRGKKLARFVPIGSVLVTCIGSIGLNAIAKIPLATNQQINSIVPQKKYDSYFIYYLISNGKNKLIKYAGAGGLLMLSKNEFSKIQFSIPLLAEQKRIAHILNITRREIDLLKKLAEQYRTQKRGLMQKLLTGNWRIKSRN